MKKFIGILCVAAVITLLIMWPISDMPILVDFGEHGRIDALEGAAIGLALLTAWAFW